MVPTVDRGLFEVVFCSMAITGESPSILSTSGFQDSLKLPYIGRKSFHIAALSLRIEGIKSQGEDLPLPESPVITTNFSLGIERLTFFKLCTLAPECQYSFRFLS